MILIEIRDSFELKFINPMICGWSGSTSDSMIRMNFRFAFWFGAENIDRALNATVGTNQYLKTKKIK